MFKKLAPLPMSILPVGPVTFESTNDSAGGVAQSPQTPAITDASDDEVANTIILRNPKMDAVSFYNTLKTMGVRVGELSKKVMLRDPHQSAQSYYNALKSLGIKFYEATRKAKKNSTWGKLPPFPKSKKETNGISLLSPLTREVRVLCLDSNFLESAVSDDGIGPTVFKVVLIQEGLGNLRDAHYYTAQALQDAIPMFEGSKCYANHPARDEEENRPERSVRDIIGHFENVHVETIDGRAELRGSLVILANPSFEWARGQIIHSIDYKKKFPDKHFVGLSINASGESIPMDMDHFERTYEVPAACRPKLEEAKTQGVDTVRVVMRLADAVSCDLVTDPGAGGMILDTENTKGG